MDEKTYLLEERQRILNGDFQARFRQEVVIPFTNIFVDFRKVGRNHENLQSLVNKINEGAIYAVATMMWVQLTSQLGPHEASLFEYGITLELEHIKRLATKIYLEGKIV